MRDLTARTRLARLSTRVLGVGLASALAAVTIALALTDRLALYINPSSNVFAVSMAVLVLVGAAVSFMLPLGAEADHGHDHAHDHGDDHAHDHAESVEAALHDADGRRKAPTPARVIGSTVVAAGGVLATGVAAAIVLVPPTSLSVELAMSRDTGTAPLFQGADVVSLAATGDTESFGVGDWASVFATATNPEAFAGDEVTLTGFVTPGAGAAADAGADFALTRLVITHCVIDAQPASVPIGDAGPGGGEGGTWETGQWVTVEGTIRDVDGRLRIEARSIEPIAEPTDPYEY